MGSSKTCPRVVRALPLLLTASAFVGCEEGGAIGPDGLSMVQRAAIEEIAVDRLSDMFWIADGSHGGPFPRLAFSFSLPGVASGILGSVTVDASHAPGLFEPFCTDSAVEGIDYCLRIRRYEDGDYDLHVYYVLPPDRTPRVRPDLPYDGEGPVAMVRYRPQPLRVWEYEATLDGEVTSASAVLDERFSLASNVGVSEDFAVDGVLDVSFRSPEEVRAELFVAGPAACAELSIRFEGVEGGSAGGEIRCGERVWADLGLAPGTLVDVAWRQ